MVAQLQTKEFLDRANIRTMKKDLARLREADALRERKKISAINPASSAAPSTSTMASNVMPEDAPIKQPWAPKPISQIKVPQDIQNFFEKEAKQAASPADEASPAPSKQEPQEDPQKITRPQEADSAPAHQPVSSPQSSLKTLATEAERQQLFLLQSQRPALEAQIKAAKEKAAASIAEKNNLMIEQKEWQKKLDLVMQEEAKAPSEAEKENAEKRRWAVEKKLSTIEQAVKNADQNRAQYGAQENTAKMGLATIDNSLQAIYNGITKRQVLGKTQPKNPVVHVAHAAPTKKESPMPTPHKAIVPPPRPAHAKPYTKDMPENLKETLVASQKVEQTQRLKFMEEVEQWAATSQGKTQNSEEK